MGAVILLTATLFIGISIGVFAVHTTGFLDKPNAANTALSIQEDGDIVSVSVYDFGTYDRVEITYNNRTQLLERTGEVEFNKATTEKDLVVTGLNDTEEGLVREEIRREKI